MDVCVPTVYVLVGLPGSGKSTWAARYRDRAKERTVIVSRDCLRTMIFGTYRYDPAYEDIVRECAYGCIRTALEGGLDVIVDETHITRAKRDELRQFLRAHCPPCGVMYLVTGCPAMALENRMREPRGMTREKWAEVIEGMRAAYEPVTDEEREL